ncbi:MAG: response regulator transcription factor [Leptotrichiaceae bacterium]|jgi:DNA-binding response OmpR family regulator|nr:response regulator transcription factor [Leptotrichiaceae bacterium]
MKKVLIIEDEDKIRKIIKTFLEKKSFKIVEVADGKDAIDSFLTEKPDLVILDVMLPHKNGFEICKEIREFGNTPVLMLTAKTQDNDEINSFQLGADDFLRKPFSLEVLLVRVNKLLNISAKGVIQISNIIINEQSRNVEVAGNDIKLSPKEYDLLMYLYRNKNIAVDRDKILNDVWNFSYYGDDRTVDTHIKSLRKKIGQDIIETIRGIGYMLKI